MEHIQKLRKLILTLGILAGMGMTAQAASTELTAETTTWETGSYEVPADGVTIANHITVNGTVNLTLTAGATLTANMGITLSDGATLNVSGEGAMVVKGSNGNVNSTVTGTGTLVLKSGTLTAQGGNGGNIGDRSYGSTSGAGGVAINGIVTVNGGTLTAKGGDGGNIGARSLDSKSGAGGAAIGGSVTINAGTVTATGGNGGTIGSKNYGSVSGAGGVGIDGSVTINGGKLTTANGTGGGSQNDGTRGAGGKAVNGTVTCGEGVTQSGDTYEGPDIAQGPDKTALNTAITAAETLYNSIKEVENYSTIASTLKAAIDAAKGVANSDTAAQNDVDAATTAITTAKTNAEAAKKDVDDTTEANKVSTQIADLPAKEEITKDHKNKVDAAKAAYDALTDDQKKKVSDANKQKLSDAIAAIEKDKADTEAANAVIAKINALPATDAITSANKDAIEAARAAYDALTDAQKAKISDTVKNKLKAAENALVAAEQPVTVAAKADPSTTGTYYATFYDSTTSYVADCEVYYATANADGRLTLEKAEGNVIKADEGVILKATSETVTLTPTTTEASYDSLLTGSDRETTVENALVLSLGKNGVWFYKYSGTLGANKAYLAQ